MDKKEERTALAFYLLSLEKIYHTGHFFIMITRKLQTMQPVLSASMIPKLTTSFFLGNGSSCLTDPSYVMERSNPWHYSI